MALICCRQGGGGNGHGGALLSFRRLAESRRREHRGAEALEDVVLVGVAVPVLVAGALELEAELQSLADHSGDVGVVEGKAELVGEAVAGAVDVDGVDVGRALPVVGGVANDDLLVEVLESKVIKLLPSASLTFVPK